MFDQIDALEQALERKRLYGVYPATVVDIKDPDNQGRVKIQLPWSPDGAGAGYQVWARLATLMAGDERGTWFIPDPGDEMLAMFEAGDPRRPYLVGGLWNGRDAPPVAMDRDGNNHQKAIVSRRGIRITFDDAENQETLVIETPGGQMITLEDGSGMVLIEDSRGNTITLDADGVTVDATSQVTVRATQITVNATMITVNAPMTKFSGVVKADAFITNSVVSASYTPGMGSIL